MPKLLLYPAFPDQETLFNQIFRVIWHFAPMATRIDQVIIPWAGGGTISVDMDAALQDAGTVLSKDFDPYIATLAKSYLGKFQIVGPGVEDLVGDDLAGILVWNTSQAPTVRFAQELGRKYESQVVLVDPTRRQQETLESIRFAYTLWTPGELNDLVAASYSAFCGVLERWRGKKISAFGNGLSLGRVVREKIDPGPTLRAVCNSTIGDSAALEFLSPNLLFCGDPVQHCGVSLYAGEFRRGLADAMKDPDRILLTQLGYVPYFRLTTAPECHDRIIGIGNDRRATFNLNLAEEFLTAATANIFTMLVLPVACSLSHEIDIYGCDGMPFTAATKPWSHSDEDDYMSKMSVTHRVHSGFWKRNYEEEYWSYCRDMADLLSLAESSGRKVQVKTPSFVPALAQRFRA